MARLQAQRVPAFLKAICTNNAARLGMVQEMLDSLNLRGFEHGCLCRDSPATPGCLTKESQPTMTSRTWRQFAAEWPHIVAGMLGPALFARPTADMATGKGLGHGAAGGETRSGGGIGAGGDLSAGVMGATVRGVAAGAGSVAPPAAAGRLASAAARSVGGTPADAMGGADDAQHGEDDEAPLHSMGLFDDED